MHFLGRENPARGERSRNTSHALILMGDWCALFLENSATKEVKNRTRKVWQYGSCIKATLACYARK